MRGLDLSSNISSDSAGPSEFGNCSNERAPKEEKPKVGKIYYVADRVMGVELTYDRTGNTLLIGSREGESQAQTLFTLD